MKYQLLRAIAVIWQLAGFLLFILALLQIPSILQYIQAGGALAWQAQNLKFILIPVGNCLLTALGALSLIGLGELVGVLLSLEENTRYTADYLRQRSKPKQE